MMQIEDYKEQALKVNMPEDDFKDLMNYGVNQIFTFFADRVEEVSAFLYIIDEQLKSAFLSKRF